MNTIAGVTRPGFLGAIAAERSKVDMVSWNRPSHIGTGDILLFSGRTWAARSVRWMTNSPWSHVAVVVYEPELYAEPMVFEATRCSPLKDLVRGICVRDGVQLVSLSEKLATYPGRVVLRPWHADVVRPSASMVHSVLEAHLQRPYIDYVRRNICQWLGRPAAPGTFCSEFVVDVLRAWGMWGAGRPSRLYVPRDFAEPLLQDAGTPGFSQVLTLKVGADRELLRQDTPWAMV